MSEESDVDLDMEGVVEVNFKVFYLKFIFLRRPQNIAKSPP